MNKRHAKPTAQQLANRTYRKQITMQAQILTIIEQLETLRSGQQMLSQRMESFRVLADHCARLLREKETLQKALKDAEQFMCTPTTIHTELKQPLQWMLPTASSRCAFELLHRPGVFCAVCGELTLEESCL